MKSQTVYTNKGFTLVEILVVIGLIGMVLTIGSLVNLNMFTRELSYSEVDTLVGVLQNARNRAMNNINAMPHGVHYEDGNASYVIFEGNTYDGDGIEVPRPMEGGEVNTNVNITMDGDEEFNIVFAQLSGEVNGSDTGTILIDNTSGIDKGIIISENGLIDW